MLPLTRYLSLSAAAVALLAIAVATVSRAQDHSGHQMPGMNMPPAGAAPASGPPLPSGYAEVKIAPEIQQRIGVTVGRVEKTPLVMNIRTVGIVRPNETKIAHIHLKTEGWVEKLFISVTGQKVRAGDPMLSIYSPAFFAAQREFLAALQYSRTAPSEAQRTVVETTRQRLALWDVPKSTIDELERTGRPGKSLVLRSPITGTVLEKKAFQGQYVMPQAELYTVADLSTVWVQAKIFAYELPHVALGMPAKVTFPSLANRAFDGKVVFIEPVVEEAARTVQVRVELNNPDGVIKPGMFANVLISHEMGVGLTVSSSAIIRTGERDIAFKVAAIDRFVPVEVKISPLAFDGRFQVLSGLKAGEEIVTSANFLIDSESRLRAGGGSMAGMQHGGGEQNAPNPPGQLGSGKAAPPAPDHSKMGH
ncbi:efflux RND transporter periplasmic adaptor subunit [Methylocystis echinoides]|uniref:PTS cellobiose transporter subunit IIB n=1 Tax=Methylocystis echinoides TaxID=29468 RepID=A0A9W6GY74_9HYPH|nr:efflux RND transporter periplasmic adaptor subunit [Methylocystis echinoides]RTL81588.1 MAG: efflux RND transporter periplasmic adaptor subunit [Hyphomicrobiales bacterium]GLI95163.1 PTS cellobiose transporter subunit IIB [Methylocystis echinoides]